MIARFTVANLAEDLHTTKEGAYALVIGKFLNVCAWANLSRFLIEINNFIFLYSVSFMIGNLIELRLSYPLLLYKIELPDEVHYNLILRTKFPYANLLFRDPISQNLKMASMQDCNYTINSLIQVPFEIPNSYCEHK